VVGRQVEAEVEDVAGIRGMRLTHDRESSDLVACGIAPLSFLLIGEL
jgi:hypothetical protein